jgi:hypothetical protein
MAVEYTDAVRNARLDTITTAASTAAYLQVWDGALPATPATAPAGTLLASMALSNPIAPGASGGVLTIDVTPVPTDSSANAAGTPTFCRIATTETGTTTGIVQMSAGVGSGDISFSAAITSGGTVTLTSLTITDGSS